ncbi:TPA: hypothetical protein MA058_003390 [Klebsiella pneumoniae]|nr:hypothetical protein [Klebsiella pneumoniae]
MIHYTNQKRVIKLPRLAYHLLLEKVCENVTTWVVTQKEPAYKGDTRSFEFMGVIYVEEDESSMNGASTWLNHE